MIDSFNGMHTAPQQRNVHRLAYSRTMKLWLTSGAAIAIATIAVVLLVRHQTESKRTAPAAAVAKARQTEATNQPVPLATIPAAAAAPVPTPTPVAAPGVPAALEPKPPRTFPAVKLQGIAYRKERPSALINGKTMFVGEHVGEAKIIAIDPSRVTLEIEGEFRVYVLGK
jgi:hypothetical protein